jgi:hypothetical protein
VAARAAARAVDGWSLWSWAGPLPLPFVCAAGCSVNADGATGAGACLILGAGPSVVVSEGGVRMGRAVLGAICGCVSASASNFDGAKGGDCETAGVGCRIGGSCD